MNLMANVDSMSNKNLVEKTCSILVKGMLSKDPNRPLSCHNLNPSYELAADILVLEGIIERYLNKNNGRICLRLTDKNPEAIFAYAL